MNNWAFGFGEIKAQQHKTKQEGSRKMCRRKRCLPWDLKGGEGAEEERNPGIAKTDTQWKEQKFPVAGLWSEGLGVAGPVQAVLWSSNLMPRVSEDQ